MTENEFIPQMKKYIRGGRFLRKNREGNLPSLPGYLAGGE